MQTAGDCGSFEWLDPPMCDRAVQIIPGLLRRMNEYSRKEEENEQKLDDAYALVKSARKREYIMWIVIVVLIAVILIK